MADVKWIKIVTDIFDDEKMLLIERLPQADSIVVIWFKLLCLAGKQNNSGVFMLNNKIPYTDEMLSVIFRRDLSVVRLALETFVQFDMIEIIDNTYTIPNWEKHQSLDYMENQKENTRLRVSKYREKQKDLVQKECNVTVTLPLRYGNAIDKKENRIDIYNNIMSFWNEKDIIKHNKLSKEIENAIDKCLLKYSQEEICKAIENYSIVLHDIKSIFKYKWSLQDFLNRKNGIQTFMDDGTNWVNYNDKTLKTFGGFTKKEVERPEWMDKENVSNEKELTQEEMEEAKKLASKLLG